MPDLSNKCALITGAARGIGAAIATCFAEAGAQLILTDIDETNGEALARTLPCASFHTLDVSEEGQWNTLAGWLQADDMRPDILVNNAGITGFLETSGPHDPEHLDMASFDRVMAVNLTGTVLGCRYAIGWMKETGGTIVNIASRSGMVGIPGAAAYAASKAAIRNHTKTVALYCAEQGYTIRCNAICPAAILTPMWDAMLGDGTDRAKAIEALSADIPMGRFGKAEEVANAALYLASDASSYVTGTEIVLDGGMLAGTAASPKQRE